MYRSQNAHAYVNAGFLMKVNKADGFRVMEKPSIVFGNINASFSHATKTENFLIGKCLNKIETLNGAVEVLKQEIDPHFEPIGSIGKFIIFHLHKLNSFTVRNVDDGKQVI